MFVKVSYFLPLGYPFSTWGENLFLLFQNSAARGRRWRHASATSDRSGGASRPFLSERVLAARVLRLQQEDGAVDISPKKLHAARSVRNIPPPAPDAGVVFLLHSQYSGGVSRRFLLELALCCALVCEEWMW